MIERHPEIMRERGELGRHFDKRGMRVMGPGFLLYMILCTCLIFLTDLSGIVVVTVGVVGAVILGIIYFFHVQMHA
jgi:Flp pilus assembly protein TadB